MIKKLGKTIILGLAALSFAAFGFLAGGQNASASTKLDWTKALALYPSDRNVNVTGNYALYNKPRGTSGSKIVLSATSLANLSKSTDSHYNWRAYQIAKSSTGDYYYKIVTFNQKYRGWIYGGRSQATMTGGLYQYSTFKQGDLSATQSTGTFKLANTGNSNDNQTVTYKEPAWTQYKVGRKITDSTSYANSTFRITQAGYRTREGDNWVYVVNTDGTNKANG